MVGGLVGSAELGQSWEQQRVDPGGGPTGRARR